MAVYPLLASEVEAVVAVAGVDTRESTVLLLTTSEEDAGRLVVEVAGLAVAVGLDTSEEAGLAVAEEAGFAVAEDAGRDTVDDVFVRAALELTLEELLEEAGRATAGVEVFREAGATVEDEAGRDADDDTEVLDDVFDVAGGLLTALEEVGLDVVCAFW